MFGASFVPPATDISLQAQLPGLTFAASLVPNTEVELAGSLPQIAVSIAIVERADITITGTLPGLQLIAEARYYSMTHRPTVRQTDTEFQQATPYQTGPTTGFQDSPALPSGKEARWQAASSHHDFVHHPLPDVLVSSLVELAGRFQDASPLHNPTGWRWQEADRLIRLAINEAYEEASKLRYSTLFRHQGGDRTKRSERRTGYKEASKHLVVKGSRYQFATRLPKHWRSRYQDARRPPIGITGLPLPPGPPPPVLCYEPSTLLVFGKPSASSGTNLVFICDNWTPPAPGEQPIVVPIQRVYIVINNLYLKRVPDNTPVPAFQFSLSLDVGSWTWGFSASLPATAQALVEPTDTGPVELEASVNGTPFRVLAEEVGRERAFGQATIRISGRGRNAMLDAPYAPSINFTNATGRTHQQLYDDVLTFNGVPLGYTINYELTPWFVPTGVFNVTGTYIQALSALTQAAGAALIPHPSQLAFTVRHLYPVKPWEFGTATPNIVLPASVVTREGITWREKPAYNRVYVSGAYGSGVLGQVTRNGTAGDMLAPMVTDPLITHVDAARQRGLAILGDTGKQLEVQLRLPVLAATGILPIGALVEYDDGSGPKRGLVRSVNIEAQMPDVWQSVGLEVHHA